MFAMELPGNRPGKPRTAAFTLAEVVMAVAIAALIFGGILAANIQLTRRAEWSGQSLAAQALAIQQLEQARSALWDDSTGVQQRNELTNLNLSGWTYNTSTRVGKGYSWSNLDLPIAGTNFIRATNYVTITLLTNVTGLPAIKLQMVQVDTVWRFLGFGATRLYTNSIATYYAPDNLDPSNL
jgi:type II secretory pathway pseudopilin PulG